MAVAIEDYLALLFVEKPDLEGSSVETICLELKKKFNLNFTHRQISSVYEPIIQFEPQFIDEEEDFFNEF